MKKILILIFAIIMAFSLFGCVGVANGKDDGGKSAGGYETESGETDTGNEDDNETESGETDTGKEDGNENEEESNANSNLLPPIQNGGSFGGGKYD